MKSIATSEGIAMVKNLTGIVGLFVILAALQWLTSDQPLLMAPTNAAGAEGATLSSVQLVAIGVTMLLGIVFGNVHAALAHAKRGATIGAIVRGVLDDPGLYKALLASPILFGGVYTATLHALDPVVAFIFAFQNGFFCEALLRKQAPK